MSAVAFGLAILLSLAGLPFGDESTVQTLLYAGSSVALATGAAVTAINLARGPHSRAAAGFGILVVAEGLLWTGGRRAPARTPPSPQGSCSTRPRSR